MLLLLALPGVAKAEADSLDPQLLVRVDDAGEAATTAFLEARSAGDSLDFPSQNRLAAIYLRRLARTGDHHDLHRARALAEASTDGIPATLNTQGLLILARVEFAAHRFERAAAHARRAIALLPDDPAPVLILGDALLESGDYAGAELSYASVPARLRSDPGTAVSLAARQGRLAWLRGRSAEADRRFARALAVAEQLPPGHEQEIAWIHWQIGSLAFARGDRTAAERAQRAALAWSPGYARAIAALAQLRATGGELAQAIELYERAVELTPHIPFVSALADAYALAGQADRAKTLHARVEQIGLGHTDAPGDPTANPHGHPHDSASGARHPAARDLALFFADHGLEPQRALDLARREYAARQDIYTADALAWTALQAGALEQAQSATAQALRLGTPDPRLLYHAARIAHASGDAELARARLARVMALNPDFDPRHGAIAKELWKRLSGE